MSDEIDDLSFPNAVITRLMNEAVILLTLNFKANQYLILVRRINNDLQRSSSSYVTCGIDIHTLYQHNVCFRIISDIEFLFSLVRINMLRMQSVRQWLFKISSKPCKLINSICLLNLYKKH